MYVSRAGVWRFGSGGVVGARCCGGSVGVWCCGWDVGKYKKKITYAIGWAVSMEKAVWGVVVDEGCAHSGKEFLWSITITHFLMSLKKQEAALRRCIRTFP
ncbi:hypothetical protein GCM10009621_04480 [Corynebacterium felinum]